MKVYTCGIHGVFFEEGERCPRCFDQNPPTEVSVQVDFRVKEGPLHITGQGVSFDFPSNAQIRLRHIDLVGRIAGHVKEIINLARTFNENNK